MKCRDLAVNPAVSISYGAVRSTRQICLALLLGAAAVGCTGSITPVGEGDIADTEPNKPSGTLATRAEPQIADHESAMERAAADASKGGQDIDRIHSSGADSAVLTSGRIESDANSSVANRAEDVDSRGEPDLTNTAEASSEPSSGGANVPRPRVGADETPSNESAAQLASAIPQVDLSAAKKEKFVTPPLPPLRDGKRDVTFDTIKFDMEKDDPFDRSLLTTTVEQLVGTRIRIRGYILPSFQQRGITQFVLVRDNMECCFGPGAALFDCIVVEMAPGTSADFTTRPVAVEGVFSINELTYPDDETRYLAIYHMVADSVR